MDYDQLIDKFVDAVNISDREPVWIQDSPASIRVGEPDELGTCEWCIKSHNNADWILPLETQLPFRIPGVYRSLISRFIFPHFELDNIFFYGNTPEGKDFYEFRERLFSDWALSRVLLSNGYLQIGNPWQYNYDPLCLDINRLDGDDCPIVQIDHEAILCHDSIDVIHQVAPSFGMLIRAFIAGRA